MASYLVTGAAGFIGSTLVRELLRRGDRVRALDNFATGKRENLADVLAKIEFLESDILDYPKLLTACHGMDYVLHQAAIPSVPLSMDDPVRTHASNLNGTLNVLMAARAARVKRVVFAGSSAVYGEGIAQPKQESMLPDPVSPYAVQKMASELYMNCFAKAYGLETVCLRYFNVFGPRQDPSSPYSGVISRFITAMVEGRNPTIFGDGEQSRDFVYVDNVVQANLLAVSAAAENVVGESFNIGTGERFTLNRTFQTLSGIIGFSGKPEYAPPRPGDILHSQADISRARRYLNYAPRVTFEEGLRQTFAWYKTQAPAIEKAVTGASSR